MAGLFRRFKSTLRKKNYDSFLTDKEREANGSPDIRIEHWKGFLRNESTVIAKEKRKQAKKNRSKIRGTHNSGRFGYVGVEYKMKKKWPTRTKSITRTDVWVEAHTKKDGTVSEDIGSIMEQVKSIQLNQGENIGCSLEDDPLGKVFGKDTRGHVRGIGSLVSRTQIEASLPALAKVLSLEIKNSGLASRMTSMESHMVTMTEQMQEMMALLNGYMGMAPPMTQGNIRNVGSTSNSATTIRSKSAKVNCELLSLEREVVAKGQVVLDKHRELCHGHEVDELEEKVLLDEIVNYNATLYLGKQGGATCFRDIGEGGFVVWLKALVKYL